MTEALTFAASFHNQHTSYSHPLNLFQKQQNQRSQVTLNAYSWLGTYNSKMQHYYGSQQFIHLCTNLFCLLAATLCGYSHRLRKHTLSSSFTQWKRLAESFQSSQQCCWQLVCWNTQAEKYFLFLISWKALTMPDESCLLLTPVHLFLTSFPS